MSGTSCEDSVVRMHNELVRASAASAVIRNPGSMFQVFYDQYCRIKTENEARAREAKFHVNLSHCMSDSQ